MKKSITAVCLLGFILFGAYTTKQQSAAALAEKISGYFYRRSMEKVFMHLDKPYYSAGDEIWFAAYVTDYLSGKPTELSKILHVELFDKRGTSVLQQKIRISNGLANGFIELPDTLTANHYALKAYTNWSRNFADGLMFNHVFKIVSTRQSNEEHFADRSVEFYPEGGNLLEKKLNFVAFKTNKSSKTNAFLLNHLADTLDVLTYQGKGFGVLKIIPNSDSNYYLKFQDDDQMYALPQSSSLGATLRLQEKEDVFQLFIECSNENIGQEISLVLLSNGTVVTAFDRELTREGIFLVFRKDDLPVGLHHLLVFDHTDKLINQRLFNNAKLKYDSIVRIHGLKSYKVREPINLEVTTTHAAPGTISVSITPVRYFGHVEGSKITNNTPVAADMDKLSFNQYLIAERAHTYDPTSFLSEDDPVIAYPVQRGDYFHLNIDINSTASDQLNDDYHTILLKKGELNRVFFSKRNDSRSMILQVPSFNGTSDLTVSPHSTSMENPGLGYRLNFSAGNEPIRRNFSQNAIETDYARYIKENSAIRRLFEIDYKIEDTSAVEPYSYSVFEAYDKRIRLKDYIALPEMKEVFKELLPCTRLRELRNGAYRIELCDKNEEAEYESYMRNEPFRVIDGVPIYDSKIIADLNPSDIESINIIYGKVNINEIELYGILDIKTYSDGFKDVHSNNNQFVLQGYSDTHIFSPPRVGPSEPDFRSTLFWAPQLTIEKANTTNISFAASDEPGDYIIEIQGLTADGVPIYCKMPLTIIPH